MGSGSKSNTIVLQSTRTSGTLLSDPLPEYAGESAKDKFTRYSKIILPHIGLVLLLVCYTVVGAAVFHFFELPNERYVRAQSLASLTRQRHLILGTLWNMTVDANSNREDWSKFAEEEFRKMELWLVEGFQNGEITLFDLTDRTHVEQWTFQAAIFFASTVITTIGYGHIAPMTLAGRIFCIGFGLFGIPLLLITIADIGKFLSDLITFIYKSYRRCRTQIRRETRSFIKKRGPGRSGSGGTTITSTSTQNKDEMRITIRREARSFVKKRGRGRSGSGGTTITSTSTQNEDEMRIPIWMIRRETRSFVKKRGRGRSGSGGTTITSTSTQNEDEMRIPVWMVLLFLASYTALGGLLFRFLEGWDYFEAFYFCFITMATIGFGDIVPSKQMYMFFTMIYIVIGLAVTTMCIDLAGTEYIRKIHYFGQKIEGLKAKGLLETGLHAGEDLMKQMKGIAILRQRGLLPQDFGDLGLPDDALLSDYYGQLRNNILYEPVSPQVLKLLKPGLNIIPDEIDEEDAWILENKMFGKATFKKPVGRRVGAGGHRVAPVRRYNTIDHVMVDERGRVRRRSWPPNESLTLTPKPPTPLPIVIAPFILDETDV